MAYRILSLDGGGIRGLISTIVLMRLSREKGLADWLEGAQLLAGTSTGALIALALARGIALEEILALYRDKADEIFDDSLFDNLKDAGTLLGAQYRTEGLQRELQRLFGAARLRDLKKRVLITAFDLDNEDPRPARRRWKPKLFHNFPGSDSDGAMPVWKVGLYTSAAPTYFPSHNGYVDGGVVANNPSLAALTQTQDPRAELNPRPALGDVRMLSLGTGGILSYIAGKRHNWGYAQWAKPLINLLLDASMGIADYQCRQIMRENYHRLAPIFPPKVNIMMDEWKRSKELIKFGESADVAPTVEWLGQVGW